MKEVRVRQVYIDDSVADNTAGDQCGCAIHEAVADELKLKSDISFNEITLNEGEPEEEIYLCVKDLNMWQQQLCMYADYKWGVTPDKLEADMIEEFGACEPPDPITIVFDKGEAYITRLVVNANFACIHGIWAGCLYQRHL